MGGDFGVAGPTPGGWSVGLGDDHAHPGKAVAVVSGGLATARTRVRRWLRGGRELHHIIDSRTGRTALSPGRTVSVAAGCWLDANVVSIAAIVRGQRALAGLETLGLPARLGPSDGRVVYAGGWPKAEAA